MTFVVISPFPASPIPAAEGQIGGAADIERTQSDGLGPTHVTRAVLARPGHAVGAQKHRSIAAGSRKDAAVTGDGRNPGTDVIIVGAEGPGPALPPSVLEKSQLKVS